MPQLTWDLDSLLIAEGESANTHGHDKPHEDDARNTSWTKGVRDCGMSEKITW